MFFFVKIYKGYVDDSRNTDNAWMETVAYNFHDEDGSILSDFKMDHCSKYYHSI